MDSERIAKITYDQVKLFFESMLGTHKMTYIIQELHKLFPTWLDLWETIRKWLKEHPMTSMQHSIHSFAQLFPGYHSFARDLNDSLAIHPEFWNQVHDNLCVAKERL